MDLKEEVSSLQRTETETEALETTTKRTKTAASALDDTNDRGQPAHCDAGQAPQQNNPQLEGTAALECSLDLAEPTPPSVEPAACHSPRTTLIVTPTPAPMTRRPKDKVSLPFLLAGVGSTLAGVLLDVVKDWPPFLRVHELFVLIPPLLGLNGNLEQTLVARLSTQ
ncbi:hypothetical protein HPB47_027416, partial [Ixodes persulcatus]